MYIICFVEPSRIIIIISRSNSFAKMLRSGKRPNVTTYMRGSHLGSLGFVTRRQVDSLIGSSPFLLKNFRST